MSDNQLKIAPIVLRCTVVQVRTKKDRPNSTYSHKCMLADGHKSAHACICGSKWEDEKVDK